MKRFLLIITCIAVVFSCSKDMPFRPERDVPVSQDKPAADQLALEVISQFEWPLDEQSVADHQKEYLSKNQIDLAPTGRMMNFERTVIADKIVHYSFHIHVGPSAYDVIGLHRVVKENRPFHPIKTDKTFFYQHGDAKDFTGMTLPGTLSSSTPDDFGIAVFLAQNDVDVWGIDQAWTLTPADIPESSFMANWGVQKQVNDLTLAMTTARFTRLFTGCGFAPLNLCGYSSGVITGFALLNEETQKPPLLRNVAGFIPVDVPLKTDDQTVRDVFTAEFARVQDLINAGDYADFMGFPFAAALARSDPDGDSPMIPGFTNMQVALFFGGGPLYGTIHYHFLAGIWGDDLPVDFEYVTIDQWLDFMAAGCPWEAAAFIADYCRVIADIEDVPFDDHLAHITNPILLVGAAGGMGEYCVYGMSLLGSPDITQHIVRLKPVEDVLFDFAHIDIFLGHNSPQLVWQPILDWIESHTP